MFQIITKQDAALCAEMESFVSGHPKGHYLQSTLWPAAKPDWGWRGVLSRREDGTVCGTLSILIRKLPAGYTMLYAPRGPVCDVNDASVLKELFDGAAEVGRQCRACLLRVDPDVTVQNETFKKHMDDMGFACEGGNLSFAAIQPRFVFRLNVDGKTEEEVLAGFEQKTRYNVRLAIKKGVTTRAWSGDGEIPDEALTAFTALMEITGKRDKFLTRSKAYFANILRILGPHARLFLAYHPDGTPISGSLSVRYGNKAWYVYGASSNEHRNLMPNYLLQFEMMRWALEGGCSIYDLHGVSGYVSPDHPMYGVYRFKKGFNGDFCEFFGQFTMVYKPLVAKGLDLGLKGMKKFRRLKATLTSKKQ